MPMLVLAACLLLVLFLVIRSFWLWYWKIDKITELLTEIRDRLNKSSLPVQESRVGET